MKNKIKKEKGKWWNAEDYSIFIVYLNSIDFAPARLTLYF